MSILMALQTLLTLLPLQTSNNSSVLENESIIEVEDEIDPDEGASITDDGFLHWVFADSGGLTDSLAGVMQGLLELVFGTPIVETDGPLSFGEPESMTFARLLSNDIIPYGFYRTYEYSWLGDGGPMVILAIVTLIVGISIRGLFDMIDYNKGQQGEKNSYIVGFIWIVMWYPLFLGFVNITHAFMATFAAPDGTLTYGMIGGIVSTLLYAKFASIGAPIVIGLAVAPWAILGLMMFVRGILIVVLALGGPLLIAGKHMNLPVISRVCEGILNKTVPIVLLPAPIAPIMFVVGNFIINSGVVAGLQVIVGGVFLFAIGCLLLFATWITFKTVSPTMASAGGTLTNIGAAVGVIATGGGGSLAYSAMRGGPLAAAARAAGNRWGGNDGSRR